MNSPRSYLRKPAFQRRSAPAAGGRDLAIGMKHRRNPESIPDADAEVEAPARADGERRRNRGEGVRHQDLAAARLQDECATGREVPQRISNLGERNPELYLELVCRRWQASRYREVVHGGPDENVSVSCWRLHIKNQSALSMRLYAAGTGYRATARNAARSRRRLPSLSRRRRTVAAPMFVRDRIAMPLSSSLK